MICLVQSNLVKSEKQMHFQRLHETQNRGGSRAAHGHAHGQPYTSTLPLGLGGMGGGGGYGVGGGDVFSSPMEGRRWRVQIPR